MRHHTPTRYTPISASRPRFEVAAFAWLAVAAALLPGTSMAAVEFVTSVGFCNKVKTAGDGTDLSVQAGNDMRFEVWGDGIDVNPAVRVTVDDSNVDSLVTARIVKAHNGAENLLRGCNMAKGSVEVQVDSPAEAGATRQRSLWFRMPLGDESRLPMRAVPYRVPVWTFTNLAQNPSQCLTKNIGTVVRDLDNARMTITLPPGAASDTSNCTLEFFTLVNPADRPEIDIQKPFNYSLPSIPAFLTLTGGTTAQGALSAAVIRFTGNVANIRGTTATRAATLMIATPNPNKTDTLTLVINPPPVSNAFTQQCVCRNPQTGNTINANDGFQCEIRLSQVPPAGGQLISFQVLDRLCVAAGASSVSYSSASGEGSYTAPNTSTFHQIPFRALGGTTSAGSPCAGNPTPVSHTLKFWVGPRGAESGPAFTQCTIGIFQPR